jgi:hypothetical protein
MYRAKALSTKRPCALGESVGGGGRNGRCAAHDHVPDGGGGGLEIRQGDDLEAMRQEPLLDQAHRVGLRVEGDRPVMVFPAAEANFHRTISGARGGAPCP